MTCAKSRALPTPRPRGRLGDVDRGLADTGVARAGGHRRDGRPADDVAVEHGDPRQARQPAVAELGGGRQLRLEGGVAGRQTLLVDRERTGEVLLDHRACGDVCREVVGTARRGGQRAHDHVCGVGKAGAAGGIDGHRARGADLVDHHEADPAQQLDMVRAGRLADLERGRDVADAHGSGRRGRHRVQQAYASGVGEDGEPFRVVLGL
ncbi:hypothetical protein LP418_19215 [Nocardioides sp. B-3]|nr:hypothetical protein [Nocardioides sp. B-3]UUZ58328.1 hypothetical protein LP418_19215 [Nocardioides sp. B-3]